MCARGSPSIISVRYYELAQVFGAFKRFVSDGLHRCEYCQHVLYVIDDYRSVCLNCGAYFINSTPKPIDLFDTCSADSSRGKDDHEV